MKTAVKVISKIVITITVIGVVFAFLWAVYLISWEDVEINNLNFYCSKVTRTCTVGHFEWDGDIENMTVIIPDEVDGKKVKSLGGANGSSAPAFFQIIMPEDIKFGEEYNFTVKLGKNIKYADIFLYSYECTDYKSNVLYKVNYYYECSDDNKWIYSKDGKLYDKKTDKLIEDDIN